MFDVRDSLAPALTGANQRLREAQGELARANAAGGAPASAALARTARAAIFSEALMNATHARLAEIKAVTK